MHYLTQTNSDWFSFSFSRDVNICVHSTDQQETAVIFTLFSINWHVKISCHHNISSSTWLKESITPRFPSNARWRVSTAVPRHRFLNISEGSLSGDQVSIKNGRSYRHGNLRIPLPRGRNPTRELNNSPVWFLKSCAVMWSHAPFSPAKVDL